MGDKAAAEARRQKIRNLEYSLFGGNDKNNVSIGAIMKDNTNAAFSFFVFYLGFDNYKTESNKAYCMYNRELLAYPM